MSKRFFPRPYDFASSSVNYTSGIAVGRPRKIALPGGYITDGYSVDSPLPPQHLNTFEAMKGDAFATLAHAQMARWSIQHLSTEDNTSNIVTAAGPVQMASGQFYYFLATGVNFYAVHTTISAGWQRYTAVVNTNAAGITPKQIIGSLGGNFLIRVNASGNAYFGNVSSAGLGTDSFFGGSGQTISMIGHVGQSSGGNWLLSLTDGNLYYRAIASGTWSTATGATAIQAAYEFVQNADASVVVLSCKIGGAPTLLYSADQGASWGVGHTFATSARTGALCFMESQGVFVYLEDSTGNLYSSADGTTWVSFASGGPQSLATAALPQRNALEQGTPGLHMMSACGPCLARVIQRDDNTALHNVSQGVAYTFDFANWNYAAITSGYGTLAELYTIDGRFAAVVTGAIPGSASVAARSALATSGLLEAPAKDF